MLRSAKNPSYIINNLLDPVVHFLSLSGVALTEALHWHTKPYASRTCLRRSFADLTGEELLVCFDVSHGDSLKREGGDIKIHVYIWRAATMARRHLVISYHMKNKDHTTYLWLILDANLPTAEYLNFPSRRFSSSVSGANALVLAISWTCERFGWQLDRLINTSASLPSTPRCKVSLINESRRATSVVRQATVFLRRSFHYL